MPSALRAALRPFTVATDEHVHVEARGAERGHVDSAAEAGADDSRAGHG